MSFYAFCSAHTQHLFMALRQSAFYKIGVVHRRAGWERVKIELEVMGAETPINGRTPPAAYTSGNLGPSSGVAETL